MLCSNAGGGADADPDEKEQSDVAALERDNKISKYGDEEDYIESIIQIDGGRGVLASATGEARALDYLSSRRGRRSTFL